MREGPARQGIVLVVAFSLGAAWCLVAGPLDGDPILAFEVASLFVAGVWGAILASNLARGHRLSRALDSLSESRIFEGIQVRVVPGAGRMAVVLGTIRPAIYVGDELIEVLTADERTAVLLHEEHHRAIRAPLRAAALEAWMSIVGRYGSVRRILVHRLGDLEAMADRYAVTKGCSRSALAAALVKSEPGPVGLSARSYGAEQRIQALLDRDQALLVGQHLPYEWLPMAVFIVIAAACHALGLSLLF